MSTYDVHHNIIIGVFNSVFIHRWLDTKLLLIKLKFLNIETNWVSPNFN